MSIIIFAGPSISQSKLLEILPKAIIQPPAQQGDIYLATLQKPQIIILIDGVFESVPAVWHKEILYAMSIGIHVYGCSSMGALRAAELQAFGMVGVGQIYQGYLEGCYGNASEDSLEDDDEVTLVHGPAELQYLPVSRAMVDLRYDLNRACDHAILTQEQARIIAQQLKKLWYPDRTQAELCLIAQPIISSEKHQQLTQFLQSKDKSQGALQDPLNVSLQEKAQESTSLKEKDALELLTDIAKIHLATLPKKQVDYVLQENDAWHTLMNEVHKKRPTRLEIDLPSTLLKEEEAILPAKLRTLALEHAQELNLDFAPWIRPAFHKVALEWQCILPNGKVDFENISQKIQSLSLTNQQFNQWIEREALLMAYGDQITVQTEHRVDEQLIRQG